MINVRSLATPLAGPASARVGLSMLAVATSMLAARAEGATDTLSSNAPDASMATRDPRPTTSGSPVPTDATSPTVTEGTPVRVTIGDFVLRGRLWDNATADGLVAQLPLTLTFSDFNRLEKIARLPRTSPMAGAPAGDDPEPRDIGYYAPSGDLVLYYGDVGYFPGIVRIGRFDGGVDIIAEQTGDFTATLELAN